MPRAPNQTKHYLKLTPPQQLERVLGCIEELRALRRQGAKETANVRQQFGINAKFAPPTTSIQSGLKVLYGLRRELLAELSAPADGSEPEVPAVHEAEVEEVEEDVNAQYNYANLLPEFYR